MNNKDLTNNDIKLISHTWQVDLLDYRRYHTSNRDYKYILIAIDIFRYNAWAIPIKSKYQTDIILAFQTLFKDTQAPMIIISDNAMEFKTMGFKAYMKDSSVTTMSFKNPETISRFGKILKARIRKLDSDENKNKVWIDVLNDIITTYNNTINKTIGCKPLDVFNGIEKPHIKPVPDIIDDRFKLGDKVILVKPHVDDEQQHTIYKIIKVNKISYRLAKDDKPLKTLYKHRHLKLSI